MTGTEPSALGPAEVHRLTVELYNSGRGGEGMAYVDPDVIDHLSEGDAHGIDAWVANRKDWATGFHDASATIEQNVATGEYSTNRYILRGTHTATGRRYEVLGMDMIRVRDGRIVEHWALLDQPAMRRQLDPDTPMQPGMKAPQVNIACDDG
jgi:predicted ester cyclase